jgi:hypothetical protein
MTPEAKHARNALIDRERDFQNAKYVVENIQRTCKHEWLPVAFVPIIHKAYDAPDLYGHFTEGMPERIVHVPEKREPRWTRTCDLCGKVEETTASTEHTTTTQVPKFG